MIFSDCSKDETVVYCRCDHLTNFAVLMDIHGLFKNQVSLEFIRIVSFSFYFDQIFYRNLFRSSTYHWWARGSPFFAC